MAVFIRYPVFSFMTPYAFLTDLRRRRSAIVSGSQQEMSESDPNLSPPGAVELRESLSIGFMPAPQQYSFGPFVFDAKGRVLYRDSRDVGLPPKAAETLSLLLANAGSVVEKSTLLDAAWAGMVVGEGSLTRTISILRKALGDDDNVDAHIATMSTRISRQFRSAVIAS
jgi:DNA-binding response OmpR family regulator